MDNLQLIESLDEAIRIISAARVAGRLAAGSTAIWRISDHACTHLDKQIKDLLAPPAPEVPSIGTQIQKVLSGQEWSSDTLSDIAEILTSNGYKIADCEVASAN